MTNQRYPLHRSCRRILTAPWVIAALGGLLVLLPPKAASGQCGPTPDGLGCEPVFCPVPGEQCLPAQIEFDPVAQQYTVTSCQCMDPASCHVQPPPLPMNTGAWTDTFDDGNIADWIIQTPNPEEQDNPCTIEVSGEQWVSPPYSLKVTSPVAPYYSGQATGPDLDAAGTINLNEPYSIQFWFRYHSFHWFVLLNFGPVNLIMDQHTIRLRYGPGGQHYLGTESFDSYCPPDTWTLFRVDVDPVCQSYIVSANGVRRGTVFYGAYDTTARGFRFRETSGGGVEYIVDAYYDDVTVNGGNWCAGTTACTLDHPCRRTVDSNSGATQLIGCECAPLAQACCVQGDWCEDVRATTCLSLSGQPQGCGTECSTFSCPPREACCFGDGTCAMLAPYACIEAGGDPLEQGIDCQANLCPPSVACCLHDDTCVMLTPTACQQAGGAEGETGSNCQTTECAAPQACCLGNGTCAMLGPATCRQAGGFPWGTGTQCNTTQCPAAEACCLGNGECESLTVNACIDRMGSPMGSGTECPNTTCPQPEACCLLNGDCRELAPFQCGWIGGMNQGADTLCAATQCQQPEPCCIGNGECVEWPPWKCILWSGRPQGPVASCTGLVPVIIVQPEGSIVFEGDPTAIPLTVTAAGAPTLEYQWRKNGEPIPGATGASYDLGPVGLDDAGVYDVLVSNNCDQTASEPATVTVRPILYARPPSVIPLNPGFFYGWNHVSVYGETQIVSNDWQSMKCQDNRPITAIRWWGSYTNGWLHPTAPRYAPPQFHVGIWQGAPPDPGHPWDHPGQLIAEWTVSRADLHTEFAGFDYYPGVPHEACFQYTLLLAPEQWFFHDPFGPNRYWISLSAIYTGCPCNGDVNDDGFVNAADELIVVGRRGCAVGVADPACDACDVNCDRVVDPNDLGAVKCQSGSWPPNPACCPGPDPGPPYPWGWETRRPIDAAEAVQISAPTNPVIGSLFESGTRIQNPEGGWDTAFTLFTDTAFVPGDFNGDLDVDVSDLLVFEACGSGPTILLALGCEPADLDCDGDVDQSDFGIFQRCYSGEAALADPACAH